jgi:HEAT repeat protein
MDAQEIIRLLEEPTDNRLLVKQRIANEAPTEELISAMHRPKKPLTYAILCELLGNRKDTQAVPELISALHDADSDIRNEASQALAKIGDPRTGEALMAQYLAEQDEDVKDWHIIALGSVGYRPAIPHLIQALDIEDLRSHAVWSLGELKAQEAKAPLENLMNHESVDSYTTQLIKDAIRSIDGNNAEEIEQ